MSVFGLANAPTLDSPIVLNEAADASSMSPGVASFWRSQSKAPDINFTFLYVGKVVTTWTTGDTAVRRYNRLIFEAANRTVVLPLPL